MSSFQGGTAAKPVVSDLGSTVFGTRMPYRPGGDRISVVNALIESEALDEASFTNFLRFERRRTERTGRRFILMLLESGDLFRTPDSHNLLRLFLQALAQSTRETDIKGWYKDASVFGVIFTEIGDGDPDVITKVLLGKVTRALCNSVGMDPGNEIRFSFHVYPEDGGPRDGGTFDPALYPDESPDKRVSRLIKRAIDILGSLFALIVLSPLFLTIAAAIKLTSAGPVLFRQKRVGQGGTGFTFFQVPVDVFGE